MSYPFLPSPHLMLSPLALFPSFILLTFSFTHLCSLPPSQSCFHLVFSYTVSQSYSLPLPNLSPAFTLSPCITTLVLLYPSFFPSPLLFPFLLLPSFFPFTPFSLSLLSPFFFLFSPLPFLLFSPLSSFLLFSLSPFLLPSHFPYLLPSFFSPCPSLLPFCFSSPLSLSLSSPFLLLSLSFSSPFLLFISPPPFLIFSPLSSSLLLFTLSPSHLSSFPYLLSSFFPSLLFSFPSLLFLLISFPYLLQSPLSSLLFSFLSYHSCLPSLQSQPKGTTTNLNSSKGSQSNAKSFFSASVTLARQSHNASYHSNNISSLPAFAFSTKCLWKSCEICSTSLTNCCRFNSNIEIV